MCVCTLSSISVCPRHGFSAPSLKLIPSLSLLPDPPAAKTPADQAQPDTQYLDAAAAKAAVLRKADKTVELNFNGIIPQSSPFQKAGVDRVSEFQAADARQREEEARARGSDTIG